MTLTIRAGETQRAFTERVLLDQGRISAHEAMFDLVDESGRSKAITRLAAVIDDLRDRGWDIPNEGPHGGQAVYRLVSAPDPHGWGTPVGRVRACPSCRLDHAVGTACAPRAGH